MLNVYKLFLNSIKIKIYNERSQATTAAATADKYRVR